MGIWYECIKKFRKSEKVRVSVFEQNLPWKCEYKFSKLWLGGIAKVYFPDFKMEFEMNFNGRDGVQVKIRRKEPWRILFNYVDGHALINDDMDRNYQPLIDALLLFEKEASSGMESYEKLEKIMYQFILEYLQ